MCCAAGDYGRGTRAVRRVDGDDVRGSVRGDWSARADWH